MVKIRNLKKSYGVFPVLNGLNMDIYDGDVYGFIGRNGCGKTTTMNIICDLVPKDSGDVMLGNGTEPITIGYLPQSPTIFGYMTAREYLEYIGACTKYDGDLKKRAGEVLEVVGLSSASNRRTQGFSGGMIQRLAIAAAIFRNPDLLIFDEPTSSLDPQGRSEVIEIVGRLKSLGCTIVLSTHILHDVERVANRIGILNGGVLCEEGTIPEITKKYSQDSITLTVRNLTPENKAALLEVDFAEAEWGGDNNQFRFRADDIEEAAKRLMKTLSDNGMIVEKFDIGSASLEEVFTKILL